MLTLAMKSSMLWWIGVLYLSCDVISCGIIAHMVECTTTSMGGYQANNDSLTSLHILPLAMDEQHYQHRKYENPSSLQWRNNEHDGVSNHQPHDCLLVYSCAGQRKHQISASLALMRGIRRWPVNSPHKGPVTRKMFPSDDVIMFTMTIVPFVITCRHIPVTNRHTEGPGRNQNPPSRRLNLNTICPGILISIIKIRRSWDRLILIMGILILVSQRLHIEPEPCFVARLHNEKYNTSQKCPQRFVVSRALKLLLVDFM